LKVNKMD